MNTCKATLRVLFAHRVYLMIYLVFIGILMMSISWAMLTSASGSMSAVFESTKTRVAIIDRDSDRGDIATSMRAYLRDSSELVDLDDTSETLQQAVASNWVDLIVIIPDGFADDYVAAAADGDNPPNVDTVTSYASGSGSMARMNVGGFLSLTRTALIGAQTRVDQAALAGMMNATGGAAGFDGASLDQDMLDSLPEGQVDKPDIKDLSQAAKMAAESASDTDVNHQIAVVDTPTEESASAADTAVSGFGGTMKTALYPLSLAMTICGSMILGAFTTGEVRRRLTASPRRMVLMGLQRLLTLGGFALVVCVGYLVLSIGLMMAAGLDPLHLSVGGVLMTFGATCVYALMTVACGFMLSEFGLSEEAANGFANIFGLLIMFTSGVALPIDMMPGVMVTIAKFLPGWWYCTAIDNALGFGTAAETGISVAGWSGSLGLVALFGVMFICIGLAASMGAFLLAAGTKGKRLALPNAEIMIHQPSAGTKGKVTDMEIDVEHFLRIKRNLNEILANNTGKPIEVVTADCERDNFMTAQEALEYGLIDKVIEKR